MAANNEHTPGPWKVTPWHDGYHVEIDYNDDTAGNWAPGTWPTVGVIREEPDARLIAAAPELLAALENLSEACNDNHDGHDDFICRVCTLSVVASQVIAEARAQAVPA